MGKSYYLATPCYTDPCPDYMASMVATQQALFQAGHRFNIGYVQGLCYIHVARNWLVRNFLESKCDEMIFIDSDIGWDAAEFLNLISLEYNVIGGAAPYRSGQPGFPVALKRDKEGWPLGHVLPGGETAILEAEVVPTAMLKIGRPVFEELIKRDLATWRIETSGETGKEVKRWRSFFDFETTKYGEAKDEFCEYGEDVSFCRKCQRAGIGVWVDPRMTLRHWGKHGFAGMLDSWLKNPENAGGQRD